MRQWNLLSNKRKIFYYINLFYFFVTLSNYIYIWPRYPRTEVYEYLFSICLDFKTFESSESVCLVCV